MNKREIKRAILLAQDVVDIVNDYCFSLEEFFEKGNNKFDHVELYNHYLVFSLNLKRATRKRGFDK